MKNWNYIHSELDSESPTVECGESQVNEIWPPLVSRIFLDAADVVTFQDETSKKIRETDAGPIEEQSIWNLKKKVISP